MSCSAYRMADDMATSLCRVIDTLDDAFLKAFDSGKATDELSETDLERIRQSIWRLKRDLDELGGIGFFESVFRLLEEAFGGPEGFAATVSAWANLTDTLVQEAECVLSRQSGRGGAKRRQVKGALLYLVRRTDIDLPSIPNFIEPLMWDFALDPAVDAIVQFSNRHRLWTDRAPATPTLAGRFYAGAERAGDLLETPIRWLARFMWWIVLHRSPVSAPLRRAVDDFLLADPKPVQTVLTLLHWIAAHTREIVAVSDLISVVVLEAQFVIKGDQRLRRAYARELVLAFLEDIVGLSERGSIAHRLLTMLIEVGIDVATMLFEKRHHPNFVETEATSNS